MAGRVPFAAASTMREFVQVVNGSQSRYLYEYLHNASLYGIVSARSLRVEVFNQNL